MAATHKSGKFTILFIALHQFRPPLDGNLNQFINSPTSNGT